MATEEHALRPVSEEEAPSVEPSIADLLRKDYQELLDTKDVFIPVQGYERVGLQVKYRMPTSGKELDEIAQKVFRQFKGAYERNIYITIDTLIVLCEGLYVQPQADVLEESDAPTEPVMLDPELIGEPVKFDERLAEALGFADDVDNRARNVVRQLFGKNDMAIVAHANKLQRWLMNTKADLNVEFWQLGEAR